MKKSAFSIILILAGLATLLTTAWSQEDMEFIDNSAFDSPRRTPSVFVHDAHNETAELEECSVCHHLYEDGVLLEDESSEDQSCSECHTLDAQGNQPGLLMAFHLNCKNCHEKENKGPVMCGECHVK